RCRSCFGADLLCANCCINRHAENPLHWVEVRASLPSAVLHVLQSQEPWVTHPVSHPVREKCREPLPQHENFVVLHTNGIHEVAVDICDCERVNKVSAPEEQMLRAGWLPVTDH
ncbi:hypothetical protein DFH09DRAFT_893065, partial [Mycena vulgaris]